MNKGKLIILICLTILILIVSFIISYFNMYNLTNSSDIIGQIIGSFGSWMLPFIIISAAIKVISLIFVLINKTDKQSLNIVSLVIEIIFAMFISFTVIPFMTLNLVIWNKFVGYAIIGIFEITNIYTLFLMIKRIIIYKKKKG